MIYLDIETIMTSFESPMKHRAAGLYTLLYTPGSFQRMAKKRKSRKPFQVHGLSSRGDWIRTGDLLTPSLSHLSHFPCKLQCFRAKGTERARKMGRIAKPWYRKSKKAWYVTIGGKQVLLGRTKREAMEEFKELQRTPPTNSQHLVVILDKYLIWVQENRPKSYRWYKDYLQSFVADHKGMKVSDLKPYHVDEWSSKGGGKRGKITAMKRALNWAVEMGHIPFSPIAKMSRPEVGSRTDTISPSEFSELLFHVPDEQFRVLLQFSLEVGARPQESKNLEARHVDFERKLCVYHYTEAKKDKTRVIYLTDEAIKILKKLAKEHPEGKLFRNTRGEPWTANAVRCRFRRLEDKVGKRFTQYTFRHTWITDKLTAGVDSHIVAKLAGHSSTRELDRTYSHVVDDYKFMLEHAQKKATPPSAEADDQ